MNTEQEQQWWWLPERTGRGHSDDGASILDRRPPIPSRKWPKNTLDLKLFGRCFGGAAEESEGFSRSSRSGTGLTSVAAVSPLRRASLRAPSTA
ncbi:hypothetical protein TIFTF001_026133 [Ficus carica]|uniref:Uncharacterized protein n=1 Tax=Ficus carica TaxID=3494 RepID=A0AA88B1U5_FICCA|nr:hypothetical protein TIFTF001_026133 [Ficus carica]